LPIQYTLIPGCYDVSQRDMDIEITLAPEITIKLSVHLKGQRFSKLLVLHSNVFGHLTIKLLVSDRFEKVYTMPVHNI